MMRKVLVYGLVAGLCTALLQLLEYKWLVMEHSFEIYGGLVAAIFAGLGIWLGLKLTRKQVEVREVLVPVGPDFVRDDAQVAALGLTPRELEILALMAEGLSNREIAERAFVSENTVKTHASRVLDKLGAARRTQAIQKARELRLVP
ncbi:response regulator transcription factor [Pseudogemmatithrix spongiicola]|uniref:Response regulator transcription factor n=1 Tax=Pseudogemmatithrix spongiicola TaxID=3062599 RepID=A0AA49Q5T8_9BACT|nr:response regulator transcription factor [Gemmatimonadaceae bacterium 'strain 138']WKW16209.1 response regulator transcription factor [Gemmatimonadaceae bacterium 'strain 318']